MPLDTAALSRFKKHSPTSDPSTAAGASHGSGSDREVEGSGDVPVSPVVGPLADNDLVAYLVERLECTEADLARTRAERDGYRDAALLVVSPAVADLHAELESLAAGYLARGDEVTCRRSDTQTLREQNTELRKRNRILKDALRHMEEKERS